MHRISMKAARSPSTYYELADGYQLSVYDMIGASSYIFWRTPENERGTVKAE